MAARATQMWSGQVISRGFGPTSRRPTPAFRGFLRHTPFSVPKLLASSFHQSARAICRTERTLISRRFRSLRFSSDKRTPNPTPHLQSPEPELSVSQRLKKLSREYGWTAVGVYFTLSALDFPFCFLAVRTLGADRIAHYEHAVVEGFWNILRIPFPNLRKTKDQEGTSSESAADTAAREGNIVWGDEIEQAEALNRGANASIWTQLALAYVIHKSFIFLRVPLTAAILPKVVKTLRGWGWNIGKRTPKTSK